MRGRLVRGGGKEEMNKVVVKRVQDCADDIPSSVQT